MSSSYLVIVPSWQNHLSVMIDFTWSMPICWGSLLCQIYMDEIMSMLALKIPCNQELLCHLDKIKERWLWKTQRVGVWFQHRAEYFVVHTDQHIDGHRRLLFHTYCSVSILWVKPSMCLSPLTQERTKMLLLTIEALYLVNLLQQATKVLHQVNVIL